MSEKKKIVLRSKDPAERAAAAKAMGELRWKGVSAEERSALMKELSAHAVGVPRPHYGLKRCPCGSMTLKRAQARAGKHGTSLGHKKGCRFFRSVPKNRKVQRRNKTPRTDA